MKLSSNKENPIDILNIKLSDILSPYFKKIGLTPNGITFLSLLFGILSIYYLWNYNIFYFGITYYISYFFDCMDGHYARKYNMVSKFGDYFDHIKDVSVFLGIIYTLYKRYKASTKIWTIFITILVIFTFLMSLHLGCQEKNYENSESPTLENLKKICIGNHENIIQFTKWFGCGTWTLILILSIYFLNKNRKK